MSGEQAQQAQPLQIDKDALALVENEPTLVGYTDALKQMIEKIRVRMDEVAREKMPMELGKEEATKVLAQRVTALIHGVREAMESGKISGEEAAARRDLLLSAVGVVEGYAEEARKEYRLLQGEQRASVKQVDLISKLLTQKIAEEARKMRASLEREEQRRRRAEAAAAEEQADAGAEPSQETTEAARAAAESAPTLGGATLASDAAASDAFGDELENSSPDVVQEQEPSPDVSPVVVPIVGRRRRTPRKR